MAKKQGPVHIALGRTVRRLRDEHGWTQEGLAGEGDLHPKYVGGIERGERNPTLKVLVKLADALEVELWELFREDAAHSL